jgi:hypothetical protein
MASEVKAQRILVEDFSLLLIVTIGTLDLCLWTTPPVSISVAAQDCTKQVIKVEGVRPVAGTNACQALRPAP